MTKVVAAVKTPRETAIDQILEVARGIVSPEIAETWARILTAQKPGQGRGLKDLGVKPRRMDRFYRATYNDPKQLGVSVHELAIAIASSLRHKDAQPIDWYASPFSGTGRNAELWTRRAVGAIQRFYGLEPVNELN